MAKAQLVICKCNAVVAACAVPHCYLDKDWRKDIAKYAAQGYVIDLKENGDWQFGGCTCKKPEEVNQLELF